LAGEGWGEGVPLELPPHLNPLPKGRGRLFFLLFVQTNMSILIIEFIELAEFIEFVELTA